VGEYDVSELTHLERVVNVFTDNSGIDSSKVEWIPHSLGKEDRHHPSVCPACIRMRSDPRRLKDDGALGAAENRLRFLSAFHTPHAWRDYWQKSAPCGPNLFNWGVEHIGPDYYFPPCNPLNSEEIMSVRPGDGAYFIAFSDHSTEEERIYITPEVAQSILDKWVDIEESRLRRLGSEYRDYYNKYLKAHDKRDK